MACLSQKIGGANTHHTAADYCNLLLCHLFTWLLLNAIAALNI
jgi:hypothetical protein